MNKIPEQAGTNRARFGLKTLVAFVLGALSALAIAMLGIHAERKLRAEMSRSIHQGLSDLAFQMRYRLDRSMFERFRDIQIASSLDTFRTGSVESRRHVLERLKETYDDYAWIGFTDINGKVIVSTGELLQGEDVSQRPWFIAGSKESFVGDVHEAILLAAMLSNRHDDTLRFVDVAAPVHGSDGTLLGVLGAHLNWNWASEILDTILRYEPTNESMEIFLLNDDGTVLLDSYEGYGYTFPCPIPSADTPDWTLGLPVTCDDGRTYLSAFEATQGYRTYPGLGWQVVIRQPTEFALAPIAKLRWELFLAAGALAALFMMTGWLLASWIAQPLRAVANAADRMRHGEVDVDLPTSNRFKELAVLTRSLRSLIDSLSHTETELETSQDTNARQQRLQSAIIENMQDALFVNSDGRIVFANSACSRLFGAESKDQVIGKSPLDFFHPDNHHMIKERIRLLNHSHEQVPTVEERIVRPDGVVREVEVTAVAFQDHRNRAILVILHDITERILTERKLSHAQRMESIGQLTGGMAHDFNNMLAVVIGNLDLLRSRLKETPANQKLASKALQASQRGAELINQLLAFSRRQILDSKVVQLNELVSSMTSLLSRTLGERIEVRLILDDKLWFVATDPAQVESAIANLAINARDAMPDGGILTIETANRHLDEQYALQHPDLAAGEYVLLSISDTGTGMAPELLERVLEPFFTTKKDGKGSGLGLSMVFGFVKQSHGHLNIYSEPGHGTTIRLYLPRSTSEGIAPPDVLPELTSEHTSDVTILVVEDKHEVREVVVKQLAELGYETIEAQNADEALRIVESDQRIDLLFTDVVMPRGRTGVELARLARELRPELKILLTSGFTSALNGDEEEREQPEAFISKPYRQSDLARKIREVLADDPD